MDDDSSPESHRLRIAHTWDGHAARADEIAELTLRFGVQGLEIAVEAPFHDDPPPAGPAASTEGLWNHEVIELFLVQAATAEERQPTPRYVEIELSPHGHWLVLRFAGWRRRTGGPLPLQFSAEIARARWRGRALLATEHLPPPPYLAGAFAIHGEGEKRRYLAAHPAGGETPDFHRLQSMAELGQRRQG